MSDSARMYVFRPRYKPPHPYLLDQVGQPISQREVIPAGLPKARQPAAPGSTWQLNSSTVVQQNEDASHARDANILNTFLTRGPTSVQGTLPKSVPGQLAAAAVPAQRLTDYVGAAPSCAHAHAQQGTPIPPGHCQAIDLSNMIQTAKQPAVQSQDNWGPGASSATAGQTVDISSTQHVKWKTSIQAPRQNRKSDMSQQPIGNIISPLVSSIATGLQVPSVSSTPLPACVGFNSTPSTDRGIALGPTPGMAPGTNPGIAPGTTPGTNPGTTPGMAPGTTPGMALGIIPSMGPGTTPGIPPGSTPGRYNTAEMEMAAGAARGNYVPNTATAPHQLVTARQQAIQPQKRKAWVNPASPETQHGKTWQNPCEAETEQPPGYSLHHGGTSDPHGSRAAAVELHDELPDDTTAHSSSTKKRKKLLQQCTLPFQAANGHHVPAPDNTPIPAKPRTKKLKKQHDCEEQLPEEVLHFCGDFVEMTSGAALEQCQQAVEASAVCCLALLMKEGQHYFSTLRPLRKSQTTSILRPVAKAGSGCLAEDELPTTAPGKHTKGNPGLSHTAGQQEVVGLAILPMTIPQSPSSGHQVQDSTLTASAPVKPQQAITAPSSQTQRSSRFVAQQSKPSAENDVLASSRLWVLPLASLQATVDEAADLAYHNGSRAPEQCRALLTHLLTSSSSSVCFNMQDTLSKLLKHGCKLPDPAEINVTDPRLLAWLHEPQLLQRDEKEIEGYTLQVLASRYHLHTAVAGSAPLQPLEQLRSDLVVAVHLAAALEQCITPYMPAATVQMEMQVAALLAHMESVGMGFDAEYLLHHEGRLRSRIAVIEQEAARLVGNPINLASASQLSVALYDTLALPAPRNRSDRGSAKTHLTTDEAVLKQLAPLHPLPGLVLEYRCMQNILNKWVEPDWVKQTAAANTGGHHVRVRCSWNQTATATGRLSSSSPNLQAVTKYILGTKADVLVSQALSQEEINIRDAFVASPDCVLIGADYSQVELRVLAHLSGDPHLTHILTQAGLQGDAFALIAKTWLRQSHCADAAVICEEREKAKKVTYGIVYGLSAWGLAKGPSGLGIEVSQAQALISSFLNHFRGVKRFVQETKEAARARGFITTLGGRRRPIKALAGRGLSAQQAGAEADRKAVNSTIQGSAADLIKLAMCAWTRWQHAQMQPGMRKAVRLVAQIHDELLFEANTKLCDVYMVAGAVQQLMEGVAILAVPLSVNVTCGQQWGTMQRM